MSNPEERRILRSFATWFHLRRLRARAGTKPITDYQAATVRRDIKLAVKLLGWLQNQRLALATCTQADLDTWLAEGPEIHEAARNFLVWAVARGHAHDVVIPVRQSNRVYAVLPETDQRWTLVRDLLHNTELDTVDRVAGLLVLLFAQPAGRIVRLTTEHITTSNTGVRLTLGSKPLELPPPLDELLLHLAANRRGRVTTELVADLAGGHRHATHSLVFGAGMGLLASVALTSRWLLMLALAGFLAATAIRALELPRIGWPKSYAVAALATAAAARWLPGPWPWLPPAVVAGCWLHLAGDLLTPRGCPLLWPLPWRLEVPLIDIDTSSWRERLVVVPGLGIALVALVWTHIA